MKSRGVSLWLFGLTLFGLGEGAAAALEPSPHLDEYVHTEWPSVAHVAGPYALALARTGQLWIGTSEGAVIFDGSQMSAVAPAGRVPALSAAVLTVLAARDGTMWIGTNRRGAVHVRGPRIETLAGPDGLRGSAVTALAESSDGTIWFAGPKGVARLPPGASAPVAAVDGLPDPSVRALATDAMGAVWAGTQVGVVRWEGGRWQAEGGPADPVDALWIDPDGTVWAGTRRAGLWQCRAGHWRAFTTGDDLGAGAVSAIRRDRRGHLWVATQPGGLAAQIGERFAHVEWPDRCDETIQALAEDPDGGLWVGTERCGLHRLADRAFRVLRRRDGLPTDAILGLARDRQGMVWVGSRGHGVVRFAETGVSVPEPVPCDDARACEMCWAFAPGLDHPWLVCRDRAVMRGAGAGLARVASLPGGWTGAALVYEARDGVLWLASDKDVLRVAGSSAKHMVEQERLEGRRLFVEGRDGAMWIVASDGVARWKQDRLELYRLRGDDQPSEVSTAYEDAAGHVWLGTRGAGLRRLANGGITTVGVAQGLPTNAIIQILEDDRGRLWASSSKGIFWIEKRALDEVADGRRSSLSATLYDAADGVEFRVERFGLPAGFKDARGRLWFATSKGIVIFDPAAPTGAAPRAVVEDVRLGGRRMGSTTSWTGPLDLEATLGALSFAPADSIAFRHRLVGLDTAWVERGPSRSVLYPHLPPGHYRLEVEARGRESDWGAAASVPFSVRPPFHRTPWFVVMCGAFLGLAAFAVHQLRLGRVRAGLQAAASERARVARDIHDTLAQAFVAMSVQLECIDQAVADDDRALLRRHLDTARLVVKESLEEARRSIWVLRPQALDQGLAPAIETLVQRLSGDTVVTLEVEGTPRRLSPTVEANLLRMTQEAVANAYRHANARRIDVRLAYTSGAVTLWVRDDGAGIDGAAPQGLSQGMMGLEERAAELGGSLTVESAPGRGTTIRMEIPA